MENLEYRFYSLKEMSEIVGIPNTSNQFARDVKRKLTTMGYAFEWENRRGVRILSRTVTPEMKLKKILMERLGMNNQVKPVDFAYYILALTTIENFDRMPFLTKEKVLSEIVGYNIDDRTISRWTAGLYETGNAQRNARAALWHTYQDECGMKRQEPADPESEEYKEYTNLLAKLIQKNKEKEQDQNKDTPYGRAIKQLYGTYGRYYWCSQIMLNALGDDIEEIMRLVEEIVMQSD